MRLHSLYYFGVTAAPKALKKIFKEVLASSPTIWIIKGVGGGELARDLKEDPDLEDLPITVNGKTYVNR